MRLTSERGLLGHRRLYLEDRDALLALPDLKLTECQLILQLGHQPERRREVGSRGCEGLIRLLRQ